jgi:hypothetical protein
VSQIQQRLQKKVENFANRFDISGLIWNIHIGSGEFTSPFMKFLTGCLKDSLDVNLWNEISNLLGRTVTGIVYESLGHKTLIASDHKYTAKNINTKAKKFKTFEKSFFGMRRYLIRSVEDIEQLPNNVYGLPVISNFKIIDAVIQPNILLQFTVAKTHGKLTDNYDEIRNGLKGRKNTHVLIFVIPTENFNS